MENYELKNFGIRIPVTQYISHNIRDKRLESLFGTHEERRRKNPERMNRFELTTTKAIKRFTEKSSHRTDWWECHRTTNEAHFEWMTVNNWKYYVPLNSLLMGYSCDFSSWLSSSLHLAQKSFLFFAWLSCCCLPLLTIVFFASVFLCASVCEHWAICQGSRNTHGNSILTAYSIFLPHIWSLLS